jgi:hypothetical protein
MPIGYYNFGNVMAGNQQVVNSLAGLGQQIGHSIENHAATQSAQAMLPMLQQQYKQGLDKIASGDSAGLSDVYGASMIASQNPLLAPMASHAVNIANMANVQTQHGLRTLAAQQGALMRANIKAGGTAGAGARPMTGGQQAANTYKYRKDLNAIWDNNRDNVDKFLSGEDVPQFASALNKYQAMKQDSGVTDPNFENVLMAKQAIAAGADPKKVLEKYKALGSATKTSSPAITTPSAIPAKQAPVQLPAGLQINPSFNTGVPLSGGGSQLPAAAGAVQGNVAEAEEPEVVEPDTEDQTEDQSAKETA